MHDVTLCLSGVVLGICSSKSLLCCRSRRIHDVNQRIVRLSRDSLLSLATQFVLHYSAEVHPRRRKTSLSKQERVRVNLDNQSMMVRLLHAIYIVVPAEYS